MNTFFWRSRHFLCLVIIILLHRCSIKITNGTKIKCPSDILRGDGVIAAHASFLLSTKFKKEIVTVSPNKWDKLLSSKFDIEKETYIIIHDYRSSTKARWVSDLLSSIHNSKDVNVFLVDWRKTSDSIWYYAVAEQTLNISVLTFQFFNNLKIAINPLNKNKVNWNHLYCIGHGLGAHICGQTANMLKKDDFWKLDRITGLDPAGPCFANTDPDVRIDRNHADFVDIIHTQSNKADSLGLDMAVGHVDFYVDGGDMQAKCISNVPAELIAICSHEIATHYFIESVKNLQSGNCILHGRTWNHTHDGALEIFSLRKIDFKCSNDLKMGIGASKSNDGQNKVVLALTSQIDPQCPNFGDPEHVLHAINMLQIEDPYIKLKKTVYKMLGKIRCSYITYTGGNGPGFTDKRHFDAVEFQYEILPFMFNYTNECKDREISCKYQDEISWSKYYVLTYQSQKLPLITDNWENFDLHKFDPQTRTYVIIHGYQHTTETLWIKNLTQSIFSTRNVNVILVDWGVMSKNVTLHKYYKFAEYTPYISELTYNFFEKLKVKVEELFPHTVETEWNHIYCIGHGLGAHICGQTAKLLKINDFWKIDRITGLNPSEICFVNIDPIARLDKKDAEFVDVIHTQSGSEISLGLFQNSGHIDFYVDGGARQVKCIADDDYLWDTDVCSHRLATKYFIESIKSSSNKGCRFHGYKWDKKKETALEILQPQKSECLDCPEMGIGAAKSDWGDTFLVLTSKIDRKCAYYNIPKKVKQVLKESLTD